MVDVAVAKQTEDDKVQKAKFAFIVAVGDLTWRLASLFLIPVIVGYAIGKLTDFNNAVVIGTAIGFVLSVIYIIKLGLEANKK